MAGEGEASAESLRVRFQQSETHLQNETRLQNETHLQNINICLMSQVSTLFPIVRTVSWLRSVSLGPISASSGQVAGSRNPGPCPEPASPAEEPGGPQMLTRMALF